MAVRSVIRPRSVRVSDSSSSEDIVVRIETNGRPVDVDAMGRLVIQPAANGKDNTHRLYSYEESLKLVPWATDNPWILKGYRGRLSMKGALYSAVGCESSCSALRLLVARQWLPVEVCVAGICCGAMGDARR